MLNSKPIENRVVNILSFFDKTKDKREIRGKNLKMRHYKVQDQYGNNEILKCLAYARTAFGVDSGQFWIGLRRNSSGGIPWWWDDGSSLRWTNFGTQLSHDYVAQSIVNAKWNTFLGTEKNFFVCSYNPNFITTEYPTTTGFFVVLRRV